MFGVQEEEEGQENQNQAAQETTAAEQEQAVSPPVAQRVEPPSPALPPTANVPPNPPAATPAPAPPAAPAVATPAPETPAASTPPAIENCPACGHKITAGSEYCSDCGYSITHHEATAATASAAAHTAPQFPLKDRYQVGQLISQRLGVYRYHGQDLKHESGQPQPVIVVTSALPDEPAEAVVAEIEEPAEETEAAFLPTFDDPVAVAQEIPVEGATFPGARWEKSVLDKVDHPAIARVVDHFIEGDFEYVIEEAPQGTLIWDAWWDGDTGTRYGWLIQIAEGLHALHKAGAMIEAIRPDIVSVTDDGQAVITDLTDLLPLPLPRDIPVRGTLYTAPELMVDPEKATARAGLYSFGAMLYSLEFLGHNLEEKDFEKPFQPILITERYPDVHPAFNRLIIKTFVRDLNTRFPTSEAEKIDPTGFTELIETLQICKRNFERVRLDIAAWTTTGMIRTNNEDAFAFLHACESRCDEVYDYALLILCDGMGGYEAGEVAAAMSIEVVREFLLEKPMFATLAGRKRPEGVEFSLEECKTLLKESLQHANSTVYGEARKPGSQRRGMGCTADVVYLDDKNIVVGHVGDSRVYHVTNNTIKQLTRDQTLVNRLVELGMITAEEAENHERKNELQQAIGGQPNVEPGLYSVPLKRGDWILVCSDGLTGHIKDKELEEMLTRETSGTAEDACRRLLNLVNLRGATDNSTIVLVRTS